MSAHAPLKAYSALEAFAWALLFATALLVAMDTWHADFPARVQALGGEALVLALSAGMAALAGARVVRPAEPKSEGVPLVAYALLAARVFLLLPALAFFLLVAAAGFAA